VAEVVYTLDNTWEKAQRRLAVLETVYDPWTIARLEAIGVEAGWRCLELGAGGGSIARWLCERVGDGGAVTAVDLEPRFLEADPRPNMEIQRRDIVADGVPGEGYDFIHARHLLIHLPDPDGLIADLAGRLRPGGTLLLEECDFHAVDTAASEVYRQVWNAGLRATARAGGDWNWGRRLAPALVAAGIADVGTCVDGAIFRGGDPWAELTTITWEQLRPRLLAEGVEGGRIDAAVAELADPANWFPSCVVISAWGRRPG
jgi:SAM-dependent methyltransferase